MRNKQFERLINVFEKIEKHLYCIATQMDKQYFDESNESVYEWETKESIIIDQDFHWRKEFDTMFDYLDDVFSLIPELYRANDEYVFLFKNGLIFEKDCVDAMLFYKEILHFFECEGFKPKVEKETDNKIIITKFIKVYEE